MLARSWNAAKEKPTNSSAAPLLTYQVSSTPPLSRLGTPPFAYARVPHPHLCLSSHTLRDTMLPCIEFTKAVKPQTHAATLCNIRNPIVSSLMQAVVPAPSLLHLRLSSPMVKSSESMPSRQQSKRLECSLTCPPIESLKSPI